ncbi:hypothetical protein LMG28138_04771 [Pararobbsia alpina]|uniref:Uncharacterized protein n=1 Tax=Pararobbsia alpina TaxID=621374 RepID=A0A6S7DAF8_9BURK|nr:hypothetical protein LMG28138_04771 [Pararobbsia alpina]
MHLSWKYHLGSKARSALFGLICAATACLYAVPFFISHG